MQGIPVHRETAAHWAQFRQIQSNECSGRSSVLRREIDLQVGIEDDARVQGAQLDVSRRFQRQFLGRSGPESDVLQGWPVTRAPETTRHVQGTELRQLRIERSRQPAALCRGQVESQVDAFVRRTGRDRNPGDTAGDCQGRFLSDSGNDINVVDTQRGVG